MERGHPVGRLSEVTAAQRAPHEPAFVVARPLRIEPVAGALGAEVLGIDIAQELDDATIAAIRRTLLDHCVIFFRGPDARRGSPKAFTSRFGTLFLHPNIAGSKADPAAIDIVRTPSGRQAGSSARTGTPIRAGGGTADGRAALWCRRAALRRRYAVRQPVSRVRDAVPWHEGACCRACVPCTRDIAALRARRASRPTKVRTNKCVRIELARDPELPSGRAHASRNRPQGAVRQRPTRMHFSGMTAGRERAAARVPLRSTRPPRVHLPLPLGRPARSRSGTTAAPCTSRSTTYWKFPRAHATACRSTETSPF